MAKKESDVSQHESRVSNTQMEVNGRRTVNVCRQGHGRKERRKGRRKEKTAQIPFSCNCERQKRRQGIVCQRISHARIPQVISTYSLFDALGFAMMSTQQTHVATQYSTEETRELISTPRTACPIGSIPHCVVFLFFRQLFLSTPVYRLSVLVL